MGTLNHSLRTYAAATTMLVTLGVTSGSAQQLSPFSLYGTVSPPDGWTFIGAELTGDLHADVAAYHPSDGSVYVGHNKGTRFEFRRYATVSPAAGWTFAAGDFTGDGRCDFVGYHPSDGSLWLLRNIGSAFASAFYRTLSPAAGWSFAAGEFTGDAHADLFAYHPSDGSVWIGRNSGPEASCGLTRGGVGRAW